MLAQEQARQILRQYWDKKLPLSVTKIAHALGLKVYKSDKLGPFSGYYNKEEGSIVVNSTDILQRQRFTAAHELAHHVLGHGSSYRGPAKDINPDMERAADTFAAELLMPHEAVQTLVEVKGLGLQQLASTFNVSSEAMRIRLRKLGLI